jgi:uncharacterized protein (TIGR03435 family)
MLPLLLCMLAQTQPAFEVASVRIAVPLGPLGMRFDIHGGPGTEDPGLFTCKNCSLYMLVSMSHGGLAQYELSAPAWTRDARFDVSAKLPPGASEESFQLMMQDLLTERFKMAVHREKKEMPVYEMTIAKNGPKLKESGPKAAAKDDDAPSGKFQRDKDGFPILPSGTTMAIVPGHARLRSEDQRIAWFVDMMKGQLNAPVTDMTGLKGKYDFTLSWSWDHDEPIEPMLVDAVQSQLGLKLEKKKGSIQILVVDHAQRSPTEN